METRKPDDHVAELLSGHLDKELTQQQQQIVEVHIQACEACRHDLMELTKLRSNIGKTDLSVTRDHSWGETINDGGVRLTHNIGWLLFLGGLLIVGAAVTYEILFIDGSNIYEKLIFFSITGGIGLLFYSVLRQRLIERKTDKYKDVEI